MQSAVVTGYKRAEKQILVRDAGHELSGKKGRKEGQPCERWHGALKVGIGSEPRGARRVDS